MFEKRLIDLGQSLQDHSVRGEFFAVLDERANHIDTHGDSTVASQNVGRLQRSVFSKRPSAITNVAP